MRQMGSKWLEKNSYHLFLLVLAMAVKDVALLVLSGEETMESIVFWLGCVVLLLYCAKNVTLSRKSWGFLAAGFFCLLHLTGTIMGKILLLNETQDRYRIVSCGLLLVASDLFFGIGAKRAFMEYNQRMAWKWVVWKYASIIGGLGVTYVDYDATIHSVFETKWGCWDMIPYSMPIAERLIPLVVWHMVYWGLRIIQMMLLYYCYKAVVYKREEEE